MLVDLAAGLCYKWYYHALFGAAGEAILSINGLVKQSGPAMGTRLHPATAALFLLD